MSRYLEWLAEPGAFALLAERGAEPVGFALVTVAGGFDSWGPAERLGEVRDHNTEAVRFYERAGLSAVTVQMLGPTAAS